MTATKMRNQVIKALQAQGCDAKPLPKFSTESNPYSHEQRLSALVSNKRSQRKVADALLKADIGLREREQSFTKGIMLVNDEDNRVLVLGSSTGVRLTVSGPKKAKPINLPRYD